MEILGRFGDDNAAEFGGGVIFRDKGDDDATLLATPGLEVEHPDYWELDDYGDLDVVVYMVSVPMGESLLEWYDWVDVARVEELLDMDEGELRDLARGNLLKRAGFIEAIAEYYGWEELDPDPSSMTYEELAVGYEM